MIVGAVAWIALILTSMVLRRPRPIRRARDVRRAGVDRVVELPPDPDRAVRALARWATSRLGGREGPVGFAAVASAASDVRRWIPVVAVHIARSGRRVLLVDLTVAPKGRAGLADVGRGERRLEEVVARYRGLSLSGVGAGDDLALAIRTFGELADDLDAAYETLLVALPPIDDEAVPMLAGMLRRVVLLAPVGEISTTELRTMARDVGGLEVALIKGESPPAGAGLVSRRSSRRSTSSA